MAVAAAVAVDDNDDDDDDYDENVLQLNVSVKIDAFYLRIHVLVGSNVDFQLIADNADLRTCVCTRYK